MNDLEQTTPRQSTPQEIFEGLSINPALRALYKAQDDAGEIAPCTNYPDAFFTDYDEPGYFEAIKNAKALCATCPILKECATYAIEHEIWGIWGGLTQTERAKLRGKSKFRPLLKVKKRTV